MARRDISRGTARTISIFSASNALKRSISVKAAGDRKIHFNYKLHEKYVDGKGRKDGETAERMVHLGKAITTIKFANKGIYRLSGDNPPQLVYLHSFSKRKGMVVFVDMNTNVVRGFIPTKNINDWKDKLAKRAK